MFSPTCKTVTMNTSDKLNSKTFQQDETHYFPSPFMSNKTNYFLDASTLKMSNEIRKEMTLIIYSFIFPSILLKRRFILMQ